MCSNSNTSSTHALIKYSAGVTLPLFKYLSVYAFKSKMVVDPFKVLSPPLMTCLEHFKINPKSINMYLHKIFIKRCCCVIIYVGHFWP